jgi:hypothetical protein
MATSEQPAPLYRSGVVAHDWRRGAQLALLACGAVAPAVYVAADVIAAMRWDGYSYRDQTISELAAIGAPTRALAVTLGLVGYSFLIAFSVGVWRSGRVNRGLRVAAAALFLIGVMSLVAVPFAPIHVREAEESFTDTLHLVEGAVAGVLLLAAMALGSAAFGRTFRLYTIVTVVVMVVFLGLTAMEGSRVADDLPTPWLGIKERTWAYAYQVWIAAFALALLRRQGMT